MKFFYIIFSFIIIFSSYCSFADVNFKGKKVLITGASSGIGYATALELSKHGADIVFTYNTNKKGAEELIKEIKAHNGKVKAIKFDFAYENEKDIEKLINDAVSFLSGLDILINNAGIVDRTSSLNITNKELKNIFQINCHAPFILSKYFINYQLKTQQNKPLLEEDLPRIITVTSLSIHHTKKNMILYEASKSALLKLFENLSVEFARNVVITMVSPGSTLTEINRNYPDVHNTPKEQRAKRVPSGVVYEPTDMAKAIINILQLPGAHGSEIILGGGRHLSDAF
ncbi:MAG: SDR family oxidoreductase [Sphingobacteriia bacterium]|nr:SDR family oxidoreductase [Sphingobacteriia bacterium]